MKRISENYNDYFFLGCESIQKEWRGKPVVFDSLYIGNDRGVIEAGPFESESEVRYTFSQMIDTSGT